MKHVLVLGGAGFIGYNFIKWLNKNYPNILISVYDIMNYAGSYKSEEKIRLFYKACIGKFYGKDINSYRELELAIKEINNSVSQPIDTIINFAAQTHVDNSLENADDFWKTNIEGALTVAKIALNHSLRLHHVSTDEVYGSVKMTDDVDENFSLNPSSPYASSKAAADLCLLSQAKCLGLKLTISRCANNYGPLQHYEKLIPKVLKCIETNTQIPVYGNGMQMRDWIHVDDHSSAIYEIVTKGTIGEVYNVSGRTLLHNIDLIKELLKVQNAPESLISYVKDRTMHDVLYHVNDSKITKELNWNPTHNILTDIKNKQFF